MTEMYRKGDYVFISVDHYRAVAPEKTIMNRCPLLDYDGTLCVVENVTGTMLKLKPVKPKRSQFGNDIIENYLWTKDQVVPQAQNEEISLLEFESILFGE